MKLLCRLVIAIIYVSVWGTSAFAQGCPGPITNILYLNGVFTKESEAKASKTKLESAVRAATTLPAGCLVFDYSYNPTNNHVLDLFESVLQLIFKDPERLMNMIEDVESIPQEVREEYFSKLSVIRSIEYIEALKLEEFVDQYEQLIKNGHKIILVAHSQGNFFANLAYNELENRGYTHPLDIIQISSPDSELNSGDRHVTLFEDKLNVVWTLLGGPAPNTKILNFLPVPTCSLTDFLCHGFVTAYMRSSNARKKIAGHILTL